MEEMQGEWGKNTPTCLLLPSNLHQGLRQMQFGPKPVGKGYEKVYFPAM